MTCSKLFRTGSSARWIPKLNMPPRTQKMQVRSSVSCIAACSSPWETEFTIQQGAFRVPLVSNFLNLSNKTSSNCEKEGE